MKPSLPSREPTTPHHRSRATMPVMLAATSLVATVTLASQAGASAPAAQRNSAASATITAVLPPNSGTITASDNKALGAVTQTWEQKHPGVKVSWVPMTYQSITPSNAALVTEASAGDAPDIVWEQTGPVNSGSVPAGIIANLKPFLTTADPYDAAYPNWLDTFEASDPPYMRNPQGDYTIINASAVEVGIFYNKAIFARAHISSPPATFAQWIADMQAIKKLGGVYPYLEATGGTNCNPSWWERQFSSALLSPWVREMDVDHSEILTGRDVATGVAKNIISMKNPAYAEVWKLMGQLEPYLAPGGSQYGACSTPGTTTPPLSPQSLMVQGKVAMLWGGSWWGTQLASQGFNGKWGVFPVPTLTKATTPYATGLNVTGVQGGPYGAGTWSITTQKAASNMTPATTAQAVNLLEYLTAPTVIAKWLPAEGGDYLSLVRGTPPAPGTGILNGLLPKNLPPVCVEGILDDILTPAASDQGGRLIQEYLGGSIPFSTFSSQWQQILTQAAQQWAAQNKVTIPGLG